MTFAEYNARLCDKDLQEYFQQLLAERVESPKDETIKDTIAELQGVTIIGRLNGKTVIELREQNKIAEDLAQQGKIEESLDKIQQVLALYPEHYSAFYTLGGISFDQGNYAEAIDCFKQAFEYNPFFTDAVLKIYDCAVCMGDIFGVEDILNKALALQPNDPELLETKEHLEKGTFPERLSDFMDSKDGTRKLKRELLKLKDILESGNSQEALERIKSLV
jgi:tetratricopeptide (TPR) repeat protein